MQVIRGLMVLALFLVVPFTDGWAEERHDEPSLRSKQIAGPSSQSTDTLVALKRSLRDLNTTDEEAVVEWVRTHGRQVDLLSPEQRNELRGVATFAVSSRQCIDIGCDVLFGKNILCWLHGCTSCKVQYKFTVTDRLGGGYGMDAWRCR